MRFLALLILILVACRLPHVEPAPRDARDQRLTLAAVTSACSEPDAFGGFGAPDIMWTPDKDSTGVVISERHILTAAHAVRCPMIPRAQVQLVNGSHRMSVERDDQQFPHGSEETDVARLVKSSADNFDLHVEPPVIRDALGGEACCAATLHGRTCGTINPYHRGVVEGLDIRKGDSGAPLYCEDGALVGLVVNEGARFEPLDSYWMEGT